MDYLILRLLSSFFCGVILSQAGSFIQIGTRNILASPSTLGIEGLSVLWILLVHTLAVSVGFEGEWPGLLGIIIFGYVGYFLSRATDPNLKLERVLFIGLTFNLLVGAIFSLWQFFFLAFNLPFPVEVWFGHFRFVRPEYLVFLVVFEFALLYGLKKNWKGLRLYSLGPVISTNHSAGVSKLYAFFFIFSVAGTYLVIALFGAFSFLGLIFPLIARKFWFRKYDLKGEILFGSILNGGAFMLMDYLCFKFPVMGAEIPVGLIASVVGAVCLIIVMGSSMKAPDFLANTRK
jgi:iron complex transport system permease protein